MSRDQYIQTIEDMEALYYTPAGQALLSPDDLISPFISKADAPVLSTTTGVYNAVYGAQAWVQVNQEANTFGVVPKIPWTRSGWRVITNRAGSPPYGGQAEDGALPDTIKPVFSEISTKPKLIAVTFDNSEVQEFLATSGGDDSFAAMADLRTYFGNSHKEDMNYMLNDSNGDLANNNMESVDRVASSNSEFSNCSDNADSGYTAGDLDMYGGVIDRDASGWEDAYVGHNSGVNRTLTDALLQGLIQNTLTNGANPNGQFFQTGYDTWAVINQIYDTQVRYNLIGEKMIQAGVNGIQSQEGIKVGTSVATLFNKVLIQSKNTVVDTGGASRVYLLDTSNPEGFDYPRLFIKVAKPTQYFEAGMNQGTPFAIDRFGTEGMYRSMMEIICSFFAAQGKIRDINA